MSERSRLRFLGVAIALASLFLGLWAGLGLVGWPLRPLTAFLPEAHGVLMVNGVLASLIGLERAVALRRRPFYLAPLLTGAGSLYVALRGDTGTGLGLVTAGALVLTFLFAIILRRQPALYTATMLLGSVALVAGDLLGAGSYDILRLVPWWATFLVLVIAAERLELTRVLPQTDLNRALFAWTVALALAGAAISTYAFPTGFMVAAAGWALTAVWLVFHDIAYRNLSRPGLPRFAAASLLLGFCWLLVGSLLVVVEGGVLPGLLYDAGLHAIFLGFVLSLVFAHALVIVPAVVGRPVSFHVVLYLPLGLLHVSLALRVYADLVGNATLRAWGGLFNVVAIVLFGLLLPPLVLLGGSSRTDTSPTSLPMVSP